MKRIIDVKMVFSRFSATVGAVQHYDGGKIPMATRVCAVLARIMQTFIVKLKLHNEFSFFLRTLSLLSHFPFGRAVLVVNRVGALFMSHFH